uniref:Uncharacterized protein n=1 Tax=Trichuris muris TaxID=70415 RepID=A0A5S6PZ10_TRIMR
MPAHSGHCGIGGTEPIQDGVEAIKQALASFLMKNNNKVAEANLTTAEKKILKDLYKEKSILITKADKEMLMKNVRKPIRADPTSKLRTDLLNLLCMFISETNDEALVKIKQHLYFTSNIKCPEMYGLPKTHKLGIPMRPVVKRTAGRSGKAESVGDAVKALRKEVESLRLELTRSSQVTRADESSWQTAKELSETTHQVSRTHGGRPSGGADVPKQPDDSGQTTRPRSFGATVAQEERALSDCFGCSTRRRSVGDDVLGGGNDHWISYAERGPNLNVSSHCVPSVDPVQCIEPFDGDPRK